MIVVDSSGWIEFLQGTDRAVHFEPALCDLSKVVVPSIAVFEVHRIIAFKLGEESADAAISAMRKARIVDLGPTLRAGLPFLAEHINLPSLMRSFTPPPANAMPNFGHKMPTSTACRE